MRTLTQLLLHVSITLIKQLQLVASLLIKCMRTSDPSFPILISTKRRACASRLLITATTTWLLAVCHLSLSLPFKSSNKWSAPTSTGKTAIMELAIVRLMLKGMRGGSLHNRVRGAAKVVYMAPIKVCYVCCVVLLFFLSCLLFFCLSFSSFCLTSSFLLFVCFSFCFSRLHLINMSCRLYVSRYPMTGGRSLRRWTSHVWSPTLSPHLKSGELISFRYWAHWW